MKKRSIVLAICLLLIATPLFASQNVKAAATDEILDYTITIKPNEDATLKMDYHIEWKVLDDQKYGPLDWLSVGMPNSDVGDFSPDSDNIDSMEMSYGSVALLNIYLNKSYYKGDVAVIDFSVTQGHIYEAADEGLIRFCYTPGWFDEIAVDHIEIKWASKDVQSWSPSCFVEGDHLTWEGQLKPGGKYSVEVTYPESAFNVDIFEGYYDYEGYYSDSYYSDSYYDDSDPEDAIIGFVFFLVILIALVRFSMKVAEYGKGSGLGTEYENKITRTKIEYYPTCQGCGAAREEGQDNCAYCGRSFIKSEEKITESVKTPEAEEARTHSTAGTYHYGSVPNTYVRVNVVRVPKPAPRPTHTSSGGSHRSSCAHSSCACASHCACACACACAGGGRAGCSTKDFYNTGLKLRMLKKRAGK